MTEAEQNRLIIDHMHLVDVVAAGYRGTIDFDDLVGIGREGLVKAARSFDGKSSQFPTWAVTKIRSFIDDALKSGAYSDFGEEAVPFTADSIEKIYEFDVWGERGNASAIAEMWSKLDASPEDLSILYDDVKDKRAKFEAAFMSLSGNQRKLISWVYLIDPAKSVADAARELGVSYKQAIRMLKKALTTMRAVITRMEVNRISGGNANGHPLNDGLHGCVSGDSLAPHA